jgi:tetratricopeptide (TPR) repeat protein
MTTQSPDAADPRAASMPAGEDPALAHWLLGAELAESGRYDEAEAALAQALLRSPALHVARFQLGLLQYTAGRTAVARLTWTPLRELGVREPLPCFVRALDALADDRCDEALAQIDAGIALNVDNPPLNADMRRLAERIVRLSAQREASAEPAAASTHVLLSNYTRPQ